MTGIEIAVLVVAWFAALAPIGAGLEMALNHDFVDALFQWSIAAVFIFIGSIPLLV